ARPGQFASFRRDEHAGVDQRSHGSPGTAGVLAAVISRSTSYHGPRRPRSCLRRASGAPPAAEQGAGVYAGAPPVYTPAECARTCERATQLVIDGVRKAVENGGIPAH